LSACLPLSIVIEWRANAAFSFHSKEGSPLNLIQLNGYVINLKLWIHGGWPAGSAPGGPRGAQRMLNVRYLKVFRAIVKSGSVSGAARALNVSQPAVTKSLRMLEEDLGIALFQRVSGRLVITPEAQRLMPEVERLFGVLSGIKGMAEELREGHGGTMTIAAVTTLSLSLVSKAIAKFTPPHPHVRFELKALSTVLAAQHVATNYVDMGVLDAPTELSGMEAIPLCRSEVGCVMKRDHPLSAKEYISPPDLLNLPLITFGEETFTGMSVRNTFYAANTPMKVQCALNNTMMAYVLVRRGV